MYNAIPSLAPLFTMPSASSLLVYLVGLIIWWIIVSIPTYLAAKLVTGGRATFLQAMLATLAGPIIYAVVLGIGSLVIAAIAAPLEIIALLIAFIAWIWVYKAVFHTGWLAGFGIAILGIIVGAIIIFLLSLVGITITHGVLL